MYKINGICRSQLGLSYRENQDMFRIDIMYVEIQLECLTKIEKEMKHIIPKRGRAASDQVSLVRRTSCHI